MLKTTQRKGNPHPLPMSRTRKHTHEFIWENVQWPDVDVNLVMSSFSFDDFENKWKPCSASMPLYLTMKPQENKNEKKDPIVEPVDRQGVVQKDNTLRLTKEAMISLRKFYFNTNNREQLNNRNQKVVLFRFEFKWYYLNTEVRGPHIQPFVFTICQRDTNEAHQKNVAAVLKRMFGKRFDPTADATSLINSATFGGSITNPVSCTKLRQGTKRSIDTNGNISSESERPAKIRSLFDEIFVPHDEDEADTYDVGADVKASNGNNDSA
jgi:hypothetical protein